MPSTTSRLQKLNLTPGFHRESTKYSEEGKWYDGDRVRFREGKPENLRGYQKHSNTSLLGTARDLITWSNNNTEKLMSSGTEQRLYIYFNDYNYDVTPIVSTVSIEAGVFGNMNTSAGSPLIGVSITNHGAEVSDWIYITNASINGFGGATNFAVSSFGGPTFQVVSVNGLNNFFISVASVATSTETNMGSGTFGFLLPTEQTNNIQGLGYGAGVYNAGVSTTNARAWNQQATQSGIIFLANQWSMDNWGEDLLAVRRGGPLIYWDANASIYPVRASIVPTGPSQINSVLVSPNDRHVIALGTVEYGTSVFNPLLVRWSDQEDYTNWTPSISSTSGENQLIDGTVIIGGVRARNAIHVWTDRAMYGMQYVGPPYIFNFSQLGSNCGLISPHGAITVDGVSYWMGDNNFYRFNGRVERLDCTVRKHLYDSFNMSQKDKVYAGTNSEFNEVIWLYPQNGSDEPNAYVIYNVLEDHWVYGSSFYTTFEDRNVFDNTITTGAVDTSASSYYWDNEPEDVYDGDGQALTSYIESSEFDIADGDKIMFMNRLIPDVSISEGNIYFSIQTQAYPAGPVITKGPYIINGGTQKIDLRARGRQASIRVSTSDLHTNWRLGSMRLAIQPDGDR